MKYFCPPNLTSAPSSVAFECERQRNAEAIEGIEVTGEIIRQQVNNNISEQQASAAVAELKSKPVTSRLDTLIDKQPSGSSTSREHALASVKLLSEILATLKSSVSQSLLTATTTQMISDNVVVIKDFLLASSGDRETQKILSDINKLISSIGGSLYELSKDKNIDKAQVEDVITEVSGLKKVVDDVDGGTISDDDDDNDDDDDVAPKVPPVPPPMPPPTTEASESNFEPNNTSSADADDDVEDKLEDDIAILKQRHQYVKKLWAAADIKKSKISSRIGAITRMFNNKNPNIKLIALRLNQVESLIIKAKRGDKVPDPTETPAANRTTNPATSNSTAPRVKVARPITKDSITSAKAKLTSIADIDTGNLSLKEVLALNEAMAMQSAESSSTGPIKERIDSFANLMESKKKRDLSTALPEDKKKITRHTKKSLANAERTKKRIAEARARSRQQSGKGSADSANSSMTPGGWLGNLYIDVESLAEGRLEVFDNGKHIISRKVPADFIALLTETYNRRNKYNASSWKLYARVLALSNIQVSKKNKKFSQVKSMVDEMRAKKSAARVKRQGALLKGKGASLMPALERTELQEQLELVDGTIAGGNNNPELLVLKSELEAAIAQRR